MTQKTLQSGQVDIGSVGGRREGGRVDAQKVKQDLGPSWLQSHSLLILCNCSMLYNVAHWELVKVELNL